MPTWYRCNQKIRVTTPIRRKTIPKARFGNYADIQILVFRKKFRMWQSRATIRYTNGVPRGRLMDGLFFWVRAGEARPHHIYAFTFLLYYRPILIRILEAHLFSMATLYTHQGENVRKTWFLMGTFLVLVIAVGYGVSWYMGSSAFLYGAIIFALLMNIGSYWFSDKLVLRMTGAREATHQEFPDLWNVVENLSITAGLPMPRVYVVDDPAPNAFATGRDPEHAVVAATTGLLSMLDRTELEGVMAHELSHIGNRDMLVMTVAVVLAGFLAMLADFLTRALMFGGDDRQKNPIAIVFMIVSIVLVPIAAQLIQLAISRKREFLADASGALLTRYPEGLASALEKISRYPYPMQRRSTATAHLFIADPNGGGEKSIGQKITGLFQTHPHAEDRIRILRDMK